MSRLELRPVGNLGIRFLPRLARDLRRIFGTPCYVRKPLPVPAEAYDEQRGQFAAPALLFYLRSHGAPRSARVLGLIDEDLYADRLSFIFGQAQLPGRWGIVSLHRLRPEGSGKEATERLYMRTLKEAVHEVGHMLGLRHCPNEHCVMHFSNTIEDTDSKSSLPCERCQAELEGKVGREATSLTGS